MSYALLISCARHDFYIDTCPCQNKNEGDFWSPRVTVTRCQAPLRVRVSFSDSAGNINFYKVFHSQSESTIFQETIMFKK